MVESEVVGEVGFRFTTRFSQLIGRNLISNPIVAVSELVKNSYDADANNINVIFTQLTSDCPLLTIFDDGDGMSYDDITDKWLMVGTDNKLLNTYTNKGRRKLGEKGIGRFSVERLAKRLTITTSQLENDYALRIYIDWDEYENTQGEFSSVKHKILKIPYEKQLKGTELRLEGLRDMWDADALVNLRKELNLIRPININSVSIKKYEFSGSDVKIKLSAPDFNISYGNLELGFLKFNQAHLFGQIYEDGSAIIRVNIKSNLSTTKEALQEELKFLPEEINGSCGPLTFEVFVFFKDQRLYKSLDIDRKKFDDLLESYSGVKIYRDGFRILPFGDPDNDWLELNASRTASPEHKIGTINAIGIVYITRDNNPGLQDVLSRENMYDTAEYASLKAFVNRAFDQYTAMQLSGRKKAERKQKEQGKAALAEAKSSVKSFSRQIGGFKKKLDEIKSAESPEKQVKQIASIGQDLNRLLASAETSLNTVKSAYSYYRLQDDFKTREMQIYRNIATLGISAAMFGHEALNQTVDAKLIFSEIQSDYSGILEGVVKLQKLIADLKKDIFLIDEKADFFRNYLRREKQDRARYINLKNALTNILKQHQRAFETIDVLPVINYPEGQEDDAFTTWGYEGDFDTVFTNLVTNAYKALKQPDPNKYFMLAISCENNEIILIAENNGKPIELDIRHKIFAPLFSTYSNGTGLGLTIVQDTLFTYEGSIVLSADYPKTKFIIRIPKKGEPKE
jgi:signal transduction histidine kinase